MASISATFSDAATRGVNLLASLTSSVARSAPPLQLLPNSTPASPLPTALDSTVEKGLSFLRSIREGATIELEAAISEIPSLKAELFSARQTCMSLSQALSACEEARSLQEKRAISAEADASLLLDRLRAWRGEYAGGTSAAATAAVNNGVATAMRPTQTRREAIIAALTALEEQLPRHDVARMWADIALHAKAEVVAHTAAVETRSIANILAHEGVSLVNSTIANAVNGGGSATPTPPADNKTIIEDDATTTTGSDTLSGSKTEEGTTTTTATTATATDTVGVQSPLLNQLQPLTTAVRGIRVLSLDGGGVRGLVAIRLLREIERLTKRPISDSFDLIVGTSSGGVLAIGVTARMTLDEMENVFGAIRDNFRDTSAWLAEVKRVVVGISHDTEVAEMNLRKAFGSERRLCDLPRSPFVAVLSTSSSREPLQPFLFRSYELPTSAALANPIEGTHDAKLWEAARATSSAPTFFAPVTIGGRAFVDGALLANNPGLVALGEALVLWSDKKIDVLCCIGTGCDKEKDFKGQSLGVWATKLFELALGSSLPHVLLRTLLAGTGENQRYWRFDVEFNDPIIAVSETNPELLAKMLAGTDSYIIEQQKELESLAQTLRKH
jgi:hypothetical protein